VPVDGPVLKSGTFRNEENGVTIRVSIQTYARIAGTLGLLSFVGGGFGEAYVPSVLIVREDAGATASNILASESLFRLGFAGYLLEALCDVGLTWALYILLRPVHRNLALLAVFFRLIATCGFAVSQVLYFSALPTLAGADYLKTFSADQRESIALLSINAGGFGLEMFSMFYGAGAMVLGYLILRSEYLPRILGVLLAISGVGFVIKAFASVLAPAYASPLLLLPVAVAWLSLTVWLLAKGVDVQRWQSKCEEIGGEGGIRARSGESR
jgi:hypothetical protein